MSRKYWHTLCSSGSLAGAIALACFCLPARAGEKIIFSTPSKALTMPAVERFEKKDSTGLAAPAANFTGVDPGVAFAPQITVIVSASHSKHGRNSDRNSDRNTNRNDRDSDPNSDLTFDRDADRDPNRSDGDPERRSEFDSADDKFDGLGDNSTTKGWPSAQRSFGSVTNRWDLGKSWNSTSSKNSLEMRRATSDNDRALRGYELGAWRVRGSSDDQKDEESTSWKGSGSSKFGGSVWSRAFGDRTSFWDKSRTGGAGESKADDNKSFFQWSNGTKPAEPAGVGSSDWADRDTATGFNPTAAPLGDKTLQFGETKPEDQLGGMLKDPGGYQAPDLSSPGFSDPIPKQDFTSQPLAPPPMAPTVLPLPRMPGSLFR